MEAIDRKFSFTATHNTKGTEYTDKEGVVFLAKDNALIPTLEAYREECVRQGVDSNQLRGIVLLIERVSRWRAANEAVCKKPDVDPGAEADVVLKPNESI